MPSPSSTPPFVARALATAPRRLAAAAAVVAAGLLSSGAGFFALRSAEQARVQAEFERHAQNAARAVADGLERHTDALYALRNLFHFSAEVSRREFAGATRELIARRPGVRALEWAPRVAGVQRAAFETRMRAEGFPAFGIHTRRADGTVGPAADRADHFPVAYIEPLAGNEPALGFDLPSGRTWPKLAAAVDTGGLSTSMRIPLMTPAARTEQGYLLQLPVYSPGPEPPADAAARRARLGGFVLGVFNLADTIAALFPAQDGDVVDILFLDLSAPPENRFLHYLGAGGGIDEAARAPGSDAFAAGLHLRHTLAHGDRTWELWIRPRRSWLDARPAGQSWLALSLGLALTGLVGSSMVGAMRRERTVARLVRERTAELRAAQTALEEDVRQRRETERQLGALIAQLPGVAIRCAADEKLTAYFVSEGMVKLTGYPPDDFLAGRRHLGELSLPEDRPAARAALAAAIGHRSPFEIGYRIRDRAGEVRHVLVRGHPVFADDGTLRFLEGLAIDVTALKAAELERIAFERRLLETQKLESLGVLAGGIAHDFNNLLTAMLGNASLARHLLPPGAPGQEQLSHIEQAARRAADLCQQMLAYAGKKEVRAQPVNLSALVRTNASLLRVSIRRNTQLDLRLDDTLPPVPADAAQLQQIVMNLVINAAEAIGDEPGTITITTFRRTCDAALLRTALHRPELPAGDYAGLEVRDTGCGMAPETLARIFEPFFTTKFAGRGLGLAAVLGIVQTHGGALWVESEPGRGSTFRLLLRAPREPVPALAPPAAAAPAPGASGALSGRVLVVDDEEPVRIVLGAVLARHGLSPVLAAGGDEALRHLTGGGDFRLVLLDLTMPGLSGEQTLQAMRRTHPQLRVILMSGFSERETRERCHALGAADFVAKPFDIQVLLEKMRRALG